MFVVFLGHTLEENNVLSLMKDPQWCVFTRSMDAVTQMLDCDETITIFGVQHLVLGLKESETSHTLTTTTTGSKNSQKEANNQTDNQNSVLCPQRSLLYIVEFRGLPPSILFFNASIGWFGRFVLSTECYRTRKLDYKDLNWPRCSARVTESLALTYGGFCQKQTLYIIDYVKLVSL